MACILFVYARTSIRAAKANAQRHRDADSGGEGLSLMNEHRRRHGLDKRLDEKGTVGSLASEAKAQLMGRTEDKAGEKQAVEAKGLSWEEARRRELQGGRSGRREE
jgi:hypothetical protein